MLRGRSTFTPFHSAVISVYAISYYKSHILRLQHHLLVNNEQVGPQIGALGDGVVPGGQQIDITDHPVTTAGKTLPARGADSWRGV